METTTRRSRTSRATSTTLAIVTLGTWLSAAHRAGAVVADAEAAGAVDQVAAGSPVPALLPVALLLVVVAARLVTSATARRGRG